MEHNQNRMKFFLKNYQINKSLFITYSKNILPNLDIEDKSLVNIFFEDLYYDFLYDNIDTLFTKEKFNKLEKIVDNKYKEEINNLIINIDQEYPDLFLVSKIQAHSNDNFTKSFKLNLKPSQNKLDLLSKMMLSYKEIPFLNKNIDKLYLIKDNLKKYYFEKIMLMFNGLLLEQINMNDKSLLPQGNRKIIRESEWLHLINSLYPNNTDINNKTHSFDLMIVNNNNINFIELKNLYLKDNQKIDFFHKNNINKLIANQSLFCKVNNCNGYYYINNTNTHEKILFTIKDLDYFLKNNDEITFKKMKDYLLKVDPKKIGQDLNRKEFPTKISDVDFFNKTIHLFQKNIDNNLLTLRLNSTNNINFFNNLDNNILNNIQNYNDFKNLFMSKNLKYIDENDYDIVNTFFNNFFNKDFDFENKSMFEIRYNNLKNALNTVLKLTGRSKISLDKTNIEKEFRTRKILDTLEDLNISTDIISNKSYKNLLKNILKGKTYEDIKKNIPDGYNKDDYYRRMKPYITIDIDSTKISI